MQPDQRLTTVTNTLIERLLQAVRDLNITEPELRAALAFLTRVGQANEFVLLSDVLQVSVLVDELSHAADPQDAATAHNVEGPQYRDAAPLLPSPAAICTPDEPGEVLFLTGQVRDATTNAPIPCAVVDVWQTNLSGYYENEDPHQAEFNLRGRVQCDAQGIYDVRTVVPGPYQIARGGPVGEFLLSVGRHDWRPAHIHTKVYASGYVPLTTMLFVPGDPWLESDAIGAVKSDLIATFTRVTDPATIQSRGLTEPFITSRFDFALRQVS
ncbi:MAG: dioxygenase [Chloroflexota bacterium]